MKADEARWTGKLDWRDFKKGKTEADDDGKPPRRRRARLGTFIVCFSSWYRDCYRVALA